MASGNTLHSEHFTSSHLAGEAVRKVKYSSVRIENPLSALYRGTEYFCLARTFRTAWGGISIAEIQKKEVNQSWTLQLTSFVVREMRVELTRRN